MQETSTPTPTKKTISVWVITDIPAKIARHAYKPCPIQVTLTVDTHHDVSVEDVSREMGRLLPNVMGAHFINDYHEVFTYAVNVPIKHLRSDDDPSKWCPRKFEEAVDGFHREIAKGEDGLEFMYDFDYVNGYMVKQEVVALFMTHVIPWVFRDDRMDLSIDPHPVDIDDFTTQCLYRFEEFRIE
ncbi:hypothetical protein BJ508DRAFT_308674 [Ascobolus immersus RN42]|uniref:Uncharacterized protein n=1 Tax=Ascobolus immersus RN42 TaxID=1160509 RepID=A0A3N4HZH1_ASCIM|nr:hypothetical protein BJ508DRAFT_308674 [Ascobolus immersus RN42]